MPRTSPSASRAHLARLALAPAALPSALAPYLSGTPNQTIVSTWDDSTPATRPEPDCYSPVRVQREAGPYTDHADLPPPDAFRPGARSRPSAPAPTAAPRPPRLITQRNREAELLNHEIADSACGLHWRRSRDRARRMMLRARSIYPGIDGLSPSYPSTRVTCGWSSAATPSSGSCSPSSSASRTGAPASAPTVARTAASATTSSPASWKVRGMAGWREALGEFCR